MHVPFPHSSDGPKTGNACHPISESLRREFHSCEEQHHHLLSPQWLTLVFKPFNYKIVHFIKVCRKEEERSGFWKMGHTPLTLLFVWSPEDVLSSESGETLVCAFSLYSVMITGTSLTTTWVVMAELRSTFFNLGLFFLCPKFPFLRCLGWWSPVPGGMYCCALCWATSCAFNRGFLVEVPFLTSHISHLNASERLRYVQTLQSQ